MDWRDVCRLQSGVITRQQLRDCGLSDDAIDGLIARRDLRRILPGVFSPRVVTSTPLGDEWAGVLWSGGVLSHRSAARHWRLPVADDRRVHVTVGDRRYRKPVPGVRVHRVALVDDECTTSAGLRITSRGRTVVDLLRSERYDVARDLRDRALQQSWVTEAEIVRSIGGQLGRTGNTQLRRLLGEWEPAAHAESERRLHQLLRRARLSGWRAQYPLRLGGRTYFIDVAFPRCRLAVEVDGRRYHSDESNRFERDRQRQNALISAGWRVLRFTWAMLVDEPDRVIDQIVQLLPP